MSISEIDDKVWSINFMEYELGLFDDEVGRVEPASNPFLTKVLPMHSV